jgi:hypothetical protein
MTKRSIRVGVVAMVATACGGVVNGGTGDGADGASGGGANSTGGRASHLPLGPPDSHRSVGSVCSYDRPATVPVGGGPADAGSGPNLQCFSDADCTNGTNGRCEVGRYGRYPVGIGYCNYDACFSDGDCAGQFGACICGDPQVGSSGTRGPNVCVNGNCRIDTDCGPSGYCSLSTQSGYCGPDIPSGFFCHTTNDDCASDSDCATRPVTSRCTFDSTLHRWTCTEEIFCSG